MSGVLNLISKRAVLLMMVLAVETFIFNRGSFTDFLPPLDYNVCQLIHGGKRAKLEGRLYST